MKSVQFSQDSGVPFQELANLQVWMEDSRSFDEDAEGLLDKIKWIYENTANEVSFKDQLASSIIISFYNFSLNARGGIIDAKLLQFAFSNYRTSLHSSDYNRLIVYRVNHLGKYLKHQS